MNWLNSPEAWLALSSLTLMEIVLGIDNIVFITILASRLSPHEQNKARYGGLALAMLLRIVLLFAISWLMALTAPLFTLFGKDISGRDLILIGGGLFLLAKATFEIHEKLEGSGRVTVIQKSYAKLGRVLLQIVCLDLVFSLDSVITAIGMAESIQIMVTAVVVAVLFMMLAMKSISHFVENRPTIKMLALSFLLLIGVALIAEGWGLHISKGYIYFAMAFSLFVEMLNLRLRARPKEPVKLRPSI